MRFVFAVLVAFVLAHAAAFAEDFQYQACTADHVTAVLAVTINDDALAKQPELVLDVLDAFMKTAAGLTAEALVSPTGYQTFMANLSDTAKQAIDSIAGPPTLRGIKC